MWAAWPALNGLRAGRLQGLKQRQRLSLAVFDLVHGALPGRFVRTVTNNLGSVAKPTASEMIIGHFNNDLRVHWFPFPGSFGTPPAGTPGRVAGKSRRLPKRFEFFR